MFDAAHYLDNETSIAAYLTDILEANDAALLASALRDIARARGMTEIEPGVRRAEGASCGSGRGVAAKRGVPTFPTSRSA